VLDIFGIAKGALLWSHRRSTFLGTRSIIARSGRPALGDIRRTSTRWDHARSRWSLAICVPAHQPWRRSGSKRASRRPPWARRSRRQCAPSSTASRQAAPPTAFRRRRVGAWPWRGPERLDARRGCGVLPRGSHQTAASSHDAGPAGGADTSPMSSHPARDQPPSALPPTLALPLPPRRASQKSTHFTGPPRQPPSRILPRALTLPRHHPPATCGRRWSPARAERARRPVQELPAPASHRNRRSDGAASRGRGRGSLAAWRR
jgi:hypothetical protein